MSSIPAVSIVAFTLSLFYVAGLLLSAAVAGPLPAETTPEDRRAVGRAGVLLLVVAILVLGVPGFGIREGLGWVPLAAGVALAVVVNFLELRANTTVRAPLVAGLLRFSVYSAAALTATGTVPLGLLVLAVLVALYVTGARWLERQGTAGGHDRMVPLMLAAPAVIYILNIGFLSLPATPFAVLTLVWLVRCVWQLNREITIPQRTASELVAGISLFDATLLAATGFEALALAALALFLLALWLERHLRLSS
jgi:4-hydroxybenzoate polyprenyltransferase